jgi:hypothetical protein
MEFVDFVCLLFCCCIGIQIPCTAPGGDSNFIILWLILFSLLDMGEAVCPMCFGQAMGCSSTDAANCPWATGVAANVAAVAGAIGAAITLDKLLPPRYLRLFSRPVLQTLAIIASKPKGGASYDFTGKNYRDIFGAVVGGHVTKDEAVLHLTEQLDQAESATDKDETLINQLTRGISMVQKATAKVVSTEVTEGTFLYILAKLSTVFSNTGSFDLCVECLDDSETTSGSSSKRYSASLKRPNSASQMFSLVHQFQMVCVATGLTSIMAMGPFLDDVVYEPVRRQVLDWPTAFELMIVYLRTVENDPNRYNIGNVVAASAGMDAKREEALNIARGLYPASFFSLFRGRRGEPRGHDDDDVKQKKEGKGEFKGDIKGHNETGERGCAAWNNGNSHLAKHIDTKTGKCKFRHACNQFVSDKGPGGQCLGNHRRKDCDYDESKKCSQPSQ